MSKFLRFLGIVFLLIILVSIFEVMTEDSATQPNTKPDVTVEESEVEAETPADEPTAEPEKEEPSLPTLAEYDAIKKGMTRDQVEMLLGTVEIDFESESEFDNYVSTAVTYQAEGDFGANIMVMYGNGKVESKSNFGMK